MKKLLLPIAALAALVAQPAASQIVQKETFTLATPAGAGSDQSGSFVVGNSTQVFGGTYSFGQICGNYNSGSVALQVLGPDGVTQEVLLSRTSSDTFGGSTVTLGNNTTVSVKLNGATGCNAKLWRIPS